MKYKSDVGDTNTTIIRLLKRYLLVRYRIAYLPTKYKALSKEMRNFSVLQLNISWKITL